MSDYFDRVEQQLVRAVETQSGRGSRLRVRGEQLALVAGVLVVLVVAGIFAATHGRDTVSSSQSPGSVTVVFTPSRPVPSSAQARALDPAVATLRQRLTSVFPGARVSRTGDRILVTAPAGTHPSRARIVALGAWGRLEFFDWEANVLSARGRTVAELLGTQDPQAIRISQGSGSAAPGETGAGSMNLYAAVKLAARQPARVSADNSRLGAEFYLFGAPGSAACSTAARERGTAAVPGVHCLLAGPADRRLALRSALPPGVTGGEELVVKPGTAVVQAADSSPGEEMAFTDPRAQFYVVKDHVALFGNDVRNPRAGVDQAGTPDVSFSFTRHGQNAFQHVTAAIAHRGDLVSGLGQMLNQHFAVALDGKLLTVPQIDFKTYPDGIRAAQGADITGAFTAQSARALAAILRFGPLPVPLTAH